MKLENITIFISRDGVINKDTGSYVTKWSQFKFISHIFKVLRVFKQRGYRVIVVTNQSGINEGLMTHKDLSEIHARMRQKIYNEGGKIEHIYYCPHIEKDNCYCRKPKSGMFIDAKRNFPDINFGTSFMIGDKWSDMNAASSLGIKTCMLIDKLTDLHKCKVEPDFCISDISQAIQLVPIYFENMQKMIYRDWDAAEEDKSAIMYLDKKERFKIIPSSLPSSGIKIDAITS